MIIHLEIARQEMAKRELEAEVKLEQELIEQQLTGGIKCGGLLTVSMDTSGAEDDRVILPETYFEDLNKQDAFSIGPAFFQLKSLHTGKVTHCGVREFTAMDETVVLPEKVALSLFGPDGVPESYGAPSNVEIKYVRLPKITNVKLQPLENRFYSLENVKLMLEDNLKHHSTLTVGDVVKVWHRGQKYTLKVSAMQPTDKGSLIDTDVEVDLDESVEYREHMRKQSETEALSAPVGKTLGSASSSQSTPGTSGPATAADTNATSILSIPTGSRPIASIQGPNIEVPSEPIVGEDGVINCKFRIAGGSLTHRFLKSDQLCLLFAYLRSIAITNQNNSLSGMCETGKILQLTTRFPHRMIAETDDLVSKGATLESAGISSPIDFIVTVVVS